MSKGYLEPLVIFFWCHICACKFMQAFLPSIFQDGGHPFPVTRPPVLNSVTDSSRHTLLLPALHSQWSCQVYIIHRSVTGFLVVQEPTCTHSHEYRLLGASCFIFGVTFVHANLCHPANFYNYSKKDLQRKTIFFYVSFGNRTRDHWICSPMPYPLDYSDTPRFSIAKINI